MIDVLIVRYLFNYSWQSIQEYRLKITEMFGKDFLTKTDREEISKLKKICKTQSFTVFGVLISVIILVVTSFVVIITSSPSCVSSEVQDITVILDALKNAQQMETTRNYLLYCWSFPYSQYWQ